MQLLNKLTYLLMSKFTKNVTQIGLSYISGIYDCKNNNNFVTMSEKLESFYVIHIIKPITFSYTAKNIKTLKKMQRKI